MRPEVRWSSPRRAWVVRWGGRELPRTFASEHDARSYAQRLASPQHTTSRDGRRRRRRRSQRDPHKPARHTIRNADGTYSHGNDAICAQCGARKGRHEAEPPFANDDPSMGPACVGFRKLREGRRGR